MAAPWRANTVPSVGRSMRRCRPRAVGASSSTTTGALCGTVRAHEVLTVIETTDRPERDESDPVRGGAASVGDEVAS